MSCRRFRQRLESLLAEANISLDGQQPWDIQVHNPQFFRHTLARGSLGFGEAYVAGWWDSHRVDLLVYQALRARLDEKVRSLGTLIDAVGARLLNHQSRRRAFQVAERHYNLGNDLFRLMLDQRMIYSCGYWRNATSLNQAQENKLALCARKLKLEKGMKVLDVGCGWGGTARFLAERYGVEVVGITVSKPQAELARATCQDLPVEIRVEDYRNLRGRFDRILSIGMFEHVGPKNYRTYFRTLANLLTDDGLFLLHTIGTNIPVVTTDPWIERYIFPNGVLPAASQISKALEGFFILEDWHNFGPDYDRTLMAWHDNFHANWEQLRERYGEKFYRLWSYYLLSCAGSFRARAIQLWQILLSKKGLPGPIMVPR